MNFRSFFVPFGRRRPIRTELGLTSLPFADESLIFIVDIVLLRVCSGELFVAILVPICGNGVYLLSRDEEGRDSMAIFFNKTINNLYNQV